MSSGLQCPTEAAAGALACLAVVVIIVLMAFGQPVVAGAVLLVLATAYLAASRLGPGLATGRAGAVEHEPFCRVGCNGSTPDRPVPERHLVMTMMPVVEQQASSKPVPTTTTTTALRAGAQSLGFPAAEPPGTGAERQRRSRKRRRVVTALLAELAKQRRSSRHHQDRYYAGESEDDTDHDHTREGFQQQQQQSHGADVDAEGWVQGMAPPKPGQRRIPPSQSVPFNPKSMVNADTDGNPGTCGLVIRDHFRPGGDQAMSLKPRFGGWMDPGLGQDTSTPRRAMEAQRQVFQRNLLGYRNALLWPMYQSSEYQLRGINGRANVYDCGASPYTGSPSVPIFN